MGEIGIEDGEEGFALGPVLPVGLVAGLVPSHRGLIDVVVADRNDGLLSVYMSNGNGTFQAARAYAESTAGGSSIEVHAADLTGDGIADLMTSNPVTDRLSVFIGNADGSFSARASYNIGDAPRQAATGDFNRDGAIDILSADVNDTVVRLLDGQTTLTTTAPYLDL